MLNAWGKKSSSQYNYQVFDFLSTFTLDLIHLTEIQPEAEKSVHYPFGNIGSLCADLQKKMALDVTFPDV